MAGVKGVGVGEQDFRVAPPIVSHHPASHFVRFVLYLGSSLYKETRCVYDLLSVEDFVRKISRIMQYTHLYICWHFFFRGKKKRVSQNKSLECSDRYSMCL